MQELGTSVSSGESDRADAGDVFPAMYRELRALAEHVFRSQPAGHTLQPTALISEAWLKLDGAASVTDRDHFMRLAARAMRQVLVDHARARNAERRGGAGAAHRVTLSGLADAHAVDDPADVLALDEALDALAELSPQRASLVELRYFAGLTEQQAAHILAISRTEATRQWRMTRAWLSKRLRGDEQP